MASSPVTDGMIRCGIVAQTAAFRYRIAWAGARELLALRNIDPMRCAQIACEQGDEPGETATELVLPDGRVVDCTFREDSQTRCLVAISRWEIRPDVVGQITTAWGMEYQLNREAVMARCILLSSDTREFDSEVRQYFDDHWAHCDAPLPAAPRAPLR